MKKKTLAEELLIRISKLINGSKKEPSDHKVKKANRILKETGIDIELEKEPNRSKKKK